MIVENVWEEEMVSAVVVEVMVIVMAMVMVMVENVWECREEEMTLLPEAVGAGMWKPEYEFPAMHCSQAHTVRHAQNSQACTAWNALQGMH